MSAEGNRRVSSWLKKPGSKRTAVIRIKGAWAELHGFDAEKVLPTTCAFKHPDRRFNAAFRRGDWDGLIRLYRGNRFPAGLVDRVVERLGELKVSSRLKYEDSPLPNLDRLTKTYLTHPEDENFALYDHQLAGMQACLKVYRGVVKLATGSGKTEIMYGVARYLYEEFGYRSLVVEPKKGACRQTVERFEKYTQGEFEIGMLAEGQRRVGPITVATGQTLLGYKTRFKKVPGSRSKKRVLADPILRDVVRDFEVLLYDECHRGSSDSWFEIAMESNAVHRYGFSGTPLVYDDLLDGKLVAATGPILYEGDTDALIQQGFTAKPRIAMVWHENAHGPDLAKVEQWDEDTQDVKFVPLPYQKAYEQGVVDNPHLNAAVVRAASWFVDHGRQTLVLCRRKAHFNQLHELLLEAGLSVAGVWGSTDNSDRDHAKRAFGDRKINVVLATTIWDEAEDIPSVEAVVLADGVKATTTTLQRIGRGMRPDSEDVWFVDFVPGCHPQLTKHAIKRAETYEGEGYETVLWEKWPAPMEEDFGYELLPFEKWDEHR